MNTWARWPLAATLAFLILMTADGRAQTPSETITFRTGNGPVGSIDPMTTMLVGPQSGGFGAPFTTTQFTAALNGPNALIQSPIGAWQPNLSSDPLARWVGNQPGGSTGNTILFALPFTITQPILTATLNMNFMVDNAMGGVWLNELPISNNSAIPSGYAATSNGMSGFQQAHSLFRNDIAPLLLPGTNVIYTYLTNGGGPSGLVLSASIDIFGPTCPGNVGQGAGGQDDILTINGATDHLQVPVLAPVTIAMAHPLISSNPAPFIVFGMIGVPSSASAVNLPFGTMCFPPSILTPQANLFVLADSFQLNVGALIPASLTPWAFPIATGLPFPIQLTLQGVIAEGPGVLSVTNGVILDVQPMSPPIIMDVIPLCATPGTTISVAGSGFHPGLVLTIDGGAVVPSSITETQINFFYPVGTACDANLTVTNPDLQAASAVLNPTPTINSLSPPQGPPGGGLPSVVISGSGFSVGTTVTIGGNQAISNVLSSISIVCVPPSGSVGPAQVTVTTPGGCAATGLYTYQ